jgi:diacylglycerol kinase
MTMGFNTGKLMRSFGHALKGIRITIFTQQNFRIHILAALCVVAGGILARISAMEWCILAIVIFFVFAMELMNTAVERLVDFMAPGYDERAGAIKDISAAAVVMAALAALIAGLFIFLPKLFNLINLNL